MEADPWAPVEVELLQRGDRAATRLFCEQVRRRGLGVLHVSEADADLFARCVAAAREYFCGTEPAAKQAQRMGEDGARDWGYVEMAGVKEFWQMRLNAPDAVPWPELSREYFRCNTRLSRVALAALARGLETDEANLVDKMLDAEDGSGLSSTIFRFFRYSGGAGAAGRPEERPMGCLTHTDIGLITLIPCTNCAALERLDLGDYRWHAAEQGLGPRHLLVLCGETLERLCGFHYPAVVHRVQRVLGDGRDGGVGTAAHRRALHARQIPHEKERQLQHGPGHAAGQPARRGAGRRRGRKVEGKRRGFERCVLN